VGNCSSALPVFAVQWCPLGEEILAHEKKLKAHVVLIIFLLRRIVAAFLYPFGFVCSKMNNRFLPAKIIFGL
jgi:hypothetical protein